MRYKEEFEKNKGKGFSVVADTPELQRIKKTQDQISNVSSCPRCPSYPLPSFLIRSLTTSGKACVVVTRSGGRERLRYPRTFSLFSLFCRQSAQKAFPP